MFVKNKIWEFVQLLHNVNEDSIWIKIKTSTKALDDIYIGFYYMSPMNQTKKTELSLFTTLNEETNRFKNEGAVFILGDLNGRTATNTDFITHDTLDDTFGIEYQTNLYQRNSEDTTANNRGGELLDFCKANDFLIANGRKSGDLFGKLTCHQWNGSSVADYLVTSNIDQITRFRVGNYRKLRAMAFRSLPHIH